jgi:hypothetical protein
MYAGDKRSSLFNLFVGKEEKKLYYIGHRCQCYMFFSELLTKGQTKLECLYPLKPVKPSLTFASTKCQEPKLPSLEG